MRQRGSMIGASHLCPPLCRTFMSKCLNRSHLGTVDDSVIKDLFTLLGERGEASGVEISGTIPNVGPSACQLSLFRVAP